MDSERPLSGVEYLAQVKQNFHVMHKAVRDPKHQWDKEKAKEVFSRFVRPASVKPDCAPERLPCPKWKTKMISDFESLRDARMEDEDVKYDKNTWSSSEKILELCEKEKPDADRMKKLTYAETAQGLITLSTKIYSEDNFNLQQGLWLYSLFSCLEEGRALDAQLSSTIVQLGRKLHSWRSSIDEITNELLACCNIIITLIEDHFRIRLWY